MVGVSGSGDGVSAKQRFISNYYTAVRNEDWSATYSMLEVTGHSFPRSPLYTCATLLLARGVHAKLVQELLGHSTISITLDTTATCCPVWGMRRLGRWMRRSADRGCSEQGSRRGCRTPLLLLRATAFTCK